MPFGKKSSRPQAALSLGRRGQLRHAQRAERPRSLLNRYLRNGVRHGVQSLVCGAERLSGGRHRQQPVSNRRRVCFGFRKKDCKAACGSRSFRRSLLKMPSSISVIDRSAINCVRLSAEHRAVSEVRRVLKRNGKFLFNPYSDRHASAAAGQRGADGLPTDIRGGTLVGVGGVCFYSRGDVLDVLGEGWTVESMEHCEIVDEQASGEMRHANWRVFARKAS